MTTRILPALLAAAVLAACGSSGTSAPSNNADNAQNTARTKLRRCLREQHVDETSGQDAIQAALSGPCAKESKGAFGTTDPASDPRLQDRLTKLRACLRQKGIDTTGQIDRTDPKVQEALAACRR